MSQTIENRELTLLDHLRVFRGYLRGELGDFRKLTPKLLEKAAKAVNRRMSDPKTDRKEILAITEHMVRKFAREQTMHLMPTIEVDDDRQGTFELLNTRYNVAGVMMVFGDMTPSQALKVVIPDIDEQLQELDVQQKMIEVERDRLLELRRQALQIINDCPSRTRQIKAQMVKKAREPAE